MKRAIFLGNRAEICRVYAAQEREKLARLYGVSDVVYTKDDLNNEDFTGTEAIFSTWGMPSLTEEEIKAHFPDLKAVFYAAGSVQAFARPFLRRGVRVFSAWKANAVPVVEYTTAQILLANKGFFQLTDRTKRNYAEAVEFFRNYKGNYRAKVGILGDGAVGSGVIEALKAYPLELYVYSVTMTREQAERLGVKLASLEEIFTDCNVISNHLANNEKTKGIISRELIFKLQNYATFLNTGRGAQVDEEALCDFLAEHPTVTAVLDVTDPEPPGKGSRLLELSNVILTPHIAGSAGNEVQRMAAYMAEECERFLCGGTCRYEVTEEMLEWMA